MIYSSLKFAIKSGRAGFNPILQKVIWEKKDIIKYKNLYQPKISKINLKHFEKSKKN